MMREPIIVVVSNFYRIGAEWLSVEAWRDVEAWMSTTPRNWPTRPILVRRGVQGFRIMREEDEGKAVLPYKPVLAWIDLLTEADRGHRTHVYRSFVDAMERRVQARLYPEDDWE